jgi:homoserine kinase
MVTGAAATAPGSSANLGPGFDCLGLAVELRCHVTAVPSDDWIVEELGTSFQPKPVDFVRLAVAEAVGRPMRLAIQNEVPRSRGLGSSSAVMVAAAAASLRAMGEEPESDRLYDLVAGIEGHGDNAAAAVYGGLVAVAGDVWRHLELSPRLSFVFGIPNQSLKTAKARLALPDQISRSGAARNVARVAFLIEGLRTGDPAALLMAGGDEIHEQYRDQLSPITGELMQAARDAGALHTAWSGAGPTAIAVAVDPEPVVAAMKETLGDRGTATVMEIATTGWA